ncbi:cellulose binding domain-containing protein [Actinophytocola xanthii]|uniref:Cellulose-binding protein n=1 Tax=Actinophytocola xanthii TaxID=1912961 RepID=A0A1Q8CK81_9PSEU|nr:cellulose binding domain-containing protein [Actinophytocola xanthii]OLF14764.1 cellulose-binding protein [Actinophytocola xanthii]
MVKRGYLLGAVAALLLSIGGGAVAAQAAPEQDVGATAASAGCGSAPGLTSGSHTIQSGGQNRTYILRLPANYDQNRQYRLFFGFHWLNGTANDVDSGGSDGYNWSYYGLRRLADSANNGTIFVAPQGISNGWANSGGRDVTFVDDMLRQLQAALCVDTTQIFAGGFSYGGGMSYALACARANVFRAVVVYSGAQLSGCSGGTQPIAYMGIHGLTDNVLNISMGRSLRDTFVRNNGCTPQNPPEPAQGSRSHIVTTYSGCRAGYPVVWAAFDGGHTPAPIDGGGEGWRTWTSGEAWRFITQFQGSDPDPDPEPQPGACRVTNTVNAWTGGLTAELTISNTGTAAANGWTLAFTLPAGQAITSGWNATYSPTSGQVTARNVAHNASIAPGATVSIGFQASHTGNTGKPTSFTLNGASCAVG